AQPYTLLILRSYPLPIRDAPVWSGPSPCRTVTNRIFGPSLVCSQSSNGPFNNLGHGLGKPISDTFLSISRLLIQIKVPVYIYIYFAVPKIDALFIGQNDIITIVRYKQTSDDLC